MMIMWIVGRDQQRARGSKFCTWANYGFGYYLIQNVLCNEILGGGRNKNHQEWVRKRDLIRGNRIKSLC